MNQHEKEVLDILRKDCRLSHAEIATMIGITDSQVNTIINQLEKDRVIVKYTAIVNEDAHRHGPSRIRALVELNIRLEKTTGYDAIARTIYQYPEVTGHYLVSGQYDFLVIVEGNTHKDIAHFVFDKLATIENVTGTNTHFIFKKYKENGAMLDEPESVTRLQVTP